MRLLDLFCGTWSVGRVFASRGWTGTGVDLRKIEEPPQGFELWIWDVRQITADYVRKFDFAWASSPCQQFAVWGMRHFHPHPKYPSDGVRLFNHTREILEESGVPYVMENVQHAQMFVGQAEARCGSFFLWGNAVPPVLPQGCIKGASQMRRDGRFRRRTGVDELMYASKPERAKKLAMIPPELANCVAEYAERIIEAATHSPEAAERSKMVEAAKPEPNPSGGART